MDVYHTTDVDGISMLNPDLKSMRALLASLDQASARDADHPDVSLVHDASGWSLSVFANGTVTLENFEDEEDVPVYMNHISRQDALTMWQQLSRGEIERILKQPWIRDID